MSHNKRKMEIDHRPSFIVYRLKYWFFLIIILAGCREQATLTPTFSPLLTPTPALPTPTLAEALAALTPSPTSLPMPAITHTPTAAPTSPTATQLPVSRTPAATPTPSQTPTATPLPAIRLEMGQAALDDRDFSAAIEQFSAGLADGQNLSETVSVSAQLGLGRAYLLDGFPQETVELLGELAQKNDEAAYFVAAAYDAMGDCASALPHYQRYVAENGELPAYIQPKIARCHMVLGDEEASFAAWELAGAAPAHLLHKVAVHFQIGDQYSSFGRHEDAIRHYEAILRLAQTDFTRGRALRLAGEAAIANGDGEAGYRYFVRAVNDHPQSYDSYLGLLQLVKAGVAVDDLGRGKTDYYAGIYQPAIEALERYVNREGEIVPEAWLYLAWSYAELGETQPALSALDEYAGTDPQRALIEQADLLANAGNYAAATDNYQLYAQIYPNGEDGAYALWRAAELAEQRGSASQAIAGYQALAETYPLSGDAPAGLFRAGFLAWQAGDSDLATTLWQKTLDLDGGGEYGGAALIWLAGKVPDNPITSELLALHGARLRGDNYYVLRAKQALAGETTFQSTEEALFPPENVQAVGKWMQARFESADLDGGTVGEMPASLLADGRWRRGDKLWQLGEYQAAFQEWQAVRADVADDPVASYALARYFRDMGDYHSSILAAISVWRASQSSIFDLPPSLARLIYPAYYADMILSLAEQYGYDPLLQMALVRQESLYNARISSGAGAIGLSQVIPDTGMYIAGKLGDADFVTADLYRPDVGLQYGAFYLAEQLTLFDGNVYAALAAYNAGPGNADRWSKAADGDPDLFIELVDFSETRAYVERIFVGYEIYRLLYGSNSDARSE